MSTTDRKADAYWASFLGCPIANLHEPRTVVVPHAALSGYAGAYFLRTTEACIVSVPPPLGKDTADWLAGVPPAEAFVPAVASAYFGAAVERVIGPAYQGYLDGADFCPVDAKAARVLTVRDALALRQLAMACDETEWQHSGIGGESQVVFGCFVGEGLVAAGTGEPRGDILWHIGIVTHPAYRSQGYGRAVVSAVTAHGLESGLVPWYQTLQANAPSVTIARSRGFTQYAATIAVRLRDVASYPS
jgi:GNAT superfamily N-acetyltransferase